MFKAVLTRNSTLWACFIVTCLCSACMIWVTVHWDMQFLDSKFLPDDNLFTLGCFTNGQKEVHIWSTATLDVILPLAYSALFAGLILKGFPPNWQWLVIIPLVTLMADLFEGGLQITLLQRSFGSWPEARKSVFLLAKSALTIIKFAGFFTSLGLAIFSLIKLMRAKTGLDAPE